ncbi:MAG: NAD-binding protein [Thermoleophilia bacterium]|nr:NAD-binding protein [Thermoleophilia bacterium]
MRVLIVGSGKTLYFLGRTFSSKGYQVTIINRDRDECVQLARRLNATVVQGDGSDPEVLEDAGARGTDAVLALTSSDQDNLVICQLASLLFNVPGP